MGALCFNAFQFFVCFRASRLVLSSVQEGISLFGFFVSSGAYTPVHVATSPELKGKSGDYFVHCAPAEKSKDADDSEAAEKLWHMSEEVVGILATSNGREAASAEQECNTEDKKEK